jgi:uncharacterized DUF497 family protein
MSGSMIVIWDQNKAKANLKKHKISFEEAQTVLESEVQLILEDKDHHEDRFIALGFSKHLNLLVVVYCYRFSDVIRIISARKATKKERLMYEERI